MSLAAETDFGLSLLRQVANNESTIFSPISIALALSLVHAGAKGKSREQIRDVVMKGSSDDEFSSRISSFTRNLPQSANGVEVDIANRAYIRDDFNVNQDYINEINQKYDALSEKLDFKNQNAASETVNNFVKEITKGKISQVVKPKDFEEAKLFLVNAMYMKGEWKTKFEKKTTFNKFYADSSRTENGVKQVEYMEGHSVPLRVHYVEGITVVTLPYTDSAFGFTIFLPSLPFNLDDLRSKLDGNMVHELLSNSANRTTGIRIPKMKFEKEIDLSQILPKIGITDIFSDRDADLSGISKTKLKVDKAIHKATIELGTEGTEAAAVTAMGAVMIQSVPQVIVVDSPFIFALTYKNSPIFMGEYHG